MWQGVLEVMYFVEDRRKAAEWYSNLTQHPILFLESPEHFFIRIGNQDIWFHAADSKSPSGTGGQLAYWQVDDFDEVVSQATKMGAILHRGPLDRVDGTWMCQMRDPFGNVLGLIGPRFIVKCFA